jgi:enamine deaminase RidA (YjgF/YER057c/UK114 family)
LTNLVSITILQSIADSSGSESGVRDGNGGQVTSFNPACIAQHLPHTRDCRVSVAMRDAHDPHAARSGSLQVNESEVGMTNDAQKKHVRSYIKRDGAQERAYSPAVITQGGKIVWLAGQTVVDDEHGNSLAGNFPGQAREIFSRIAKTLDQAGGTLADIVTMTVSITDSRFGDHFTKIRKEIFGDNFPASALITVVGLAKPEMLLEVQAIAVVD